MMTGLSAQKSDIWIGISLLCFCAVAAWRTSLIRTVPGGATTGPAFVPWLMIGVIALLSVLLILRAILRPAEGAARIEMPSGTTLAKMAMFVVILVLYAVAFMSVGYLISTIIVFTLTLWLFGERRIAVLALLPAAMTGAVYVGFTQFLDVWLP